MSNLDKVEWLGVVLSVIASFLVATGINPGIGYIFYFLATLAIAYVVVKLKRSGLIALQFYFIIINAVGIFTWLI